MTTHHDPRNCDCTEHTTPRGCPDPLDEDALFWHERWHEAADQRDDRDAAAHAWKEHSRRLAAERREFRGFARNYVELFENVVAQRDEAWERLEETDRDLATAEHDRDVLHAACTAFHSEVVAIKAEREEAVATKNMHKERADEERVRADEAEGRVQTAEKRLAQILGTTPQATEEATCDAEDRKDPGVDYETMWRAAEKRAEKAEALLDRVRKAAHGAGESS